MNIMKNRAEMFAWAYKNLGMPILNDGECIIWLHPAGMLFWAKKTGRGFIAEGEKCLKLLTGQPAKVGFSTNLISGNEVDNFALGE